jgi:hypothetical protein
MEPVTALSVGIQPYPNRIRKITRYGLVTGLAPTKLVPSRGADPSFPSWLTHKYASYFTEHTVLGRNKSRMMLSHFP